QCEELVEEVVGTKFKVTPQALAAVPPGTILLRILTNLKGAYLRRRDFPRAARVIRRLCRLQPDDLGQRRDLGAALLQAGRASDAIDELEAYLGSDPPPIDSRSVRELLRQAQAEVARWN